MSSPTRVERGPFPHLFRALVLQSTVGEDWNRQTCYVAVVLEVYITAQGQTLEECRRSIEQVLFSQKVICEDFNCGWPGPAPEDYQRLRNSGDWHESVSPEWKTFCGRNQVVARWDIDLSKTKWKAVRRDDQENNAGPA